MASLLKNKLISIKIKEEKYAFNKKTNEIYDYILANQGILLKIGTLDINTNKINFLNTSNKQVTALRSLLTKKLNKIHKNNHKKFIFFFRL